RDRGRAGPSARGKGRNGSFAMCGVLEPPSARDWVGLTGEPLPIDEVNAWATTPGSGAVVCFLGVVRDHAEGRDGVTGLSYEAYEDVATRRLEEVAAETRRRWPKIERLALLPPVGDLSLSDAPAVVMASSTPPSEAFGTD